MNDKIDQAVEQSKNRIVIPAVVTLLGAAGTAVVVLAYWVVAETVDNREFRLSSTTSHFTKHEATLLKMDINERFANPPEWTKKDLAEIKADLRRLNEEVLRLKIHNEQTK